MDLLGGAATTAAPWATNITEAVSQTFLEKIFVDVTAFPNDGYGFCQLLFLGLAYGYILMQGANLIKDGSELLLLIPSWAGIVGPVVLPVLGAVPDGAIVLFSGMGPDAQSQLSVGIGALAGSTIMLLTIPWFLSMWAGRVNLDANGSGNYVRPRGAGAEWKKLSPSNRIAGTGVNVRPSIRHAAFIMAVTLVPFFVIQIPAIIAKCSLKDQEDKTCTTPRVAALVGGIFTVLLFAYYLYDQKRQADGEDLVLAAKAEEARIRALEQGIVTIAGLFTAESSTTAPQNASQALLLPDHEFRAFLKPFFRRVDKDNSGAIEKVELAELLKSLGESATSASVDAIMVKWDTDNSGNISFDEFIAAMHQVIERAAGDAPREDSRTLNNASVEAVATNRNATVTSVTSDLREEAAGDNDGDEEEEDEEMPEDLADLPPEVQRRRVLQRSFMLMGFGTIVVVLFSDPMVDVLSKLGDMTHISPFYVSFVLAPMVSNGSELIAAYFYAGKKTEKSMTIALSTLVGSAAMNNTFCLGIFLFLVYAKDLLWVFTAEITAIVLVEVIMLFIIIGSKSTMPTWLAFVILGLFPASIAVVALLENVAGLD